MKNNFMEELAEEAVSPKRILVLNSYNFLPALHGGHQRCLNLYGMLKKGMEVTVVTLNLENKYEVNDYRSEGLNFLNLSIPLAQPIVAKCRALNSQMKNRSWDLAKMLSFSETSEVARYIGKLISEHDLVILGHPWMYPYIHRFSIPFLYDAHNNEADAAKQYFGQQSLEYEVTLSIENMLLEKAAAVTACNSNDLLQLKDRAFFNKLRTFAVVPNGFTPKEYLDKNNYESRKLVFMGSGHFPNIEAAARVCEIAKNLPEYEFIIIGDAGLSLKKKYPKNLKVLGHVPEDEVLRLLKDALALINPVIQGSGTHLKVLKSLGMGLPVLTSKVGARGFDNPNQSGIEICENVEDYRIAIEKIGNEEKWFWLHSQALNATMPLTWDRCRETFERTISILGVHRREPGHEDISIRTQWLGKSQGSNFRVTIRKIWRILPFKWRRLFWDGIYQKYIDARNSKNLLRQSVDDLEDFLRG